jgi:hypothetical protein
VLHRESRVLAPTGGSRRRSSMSAMEDGPDGRRTRPEPSLLTQLGPQASRAAIAFKAEFPDSAWRASGKSVVRLSVAADQNSIRSFATKT